jgi:hypothetical protein
VPRVGACETSKQTRERETGESGIETRSSFEKNESKSFFFQVQAAALSLLLFSLLLPLPLLVLLLLLNRNSSSQRRPPPHVLLLAEQRAQRRRRRRDVPVGPHRGGELPPLLLQQVILLPPPASSSSSAVASSSAVSAAGEERALRGAAAKVDPRVRVDGGLVLVVKGVWRVSAGVVEVVDLFFGVFFEFFLFFVEVGGRRRASIGALFPSSSLSLSPPPLSGLFFFSPSPPRGPPRRQATRLQERNSRPRSR